MFMCFISGIILKKHLLKSNFSSDWVVSSLFFLTVLLHYINTSHIVLRIQLTQLLCSCSITEHEDGTADDNTSRGADTQLPHPRGRGGGRRREWQGTPSSTLHDASLPQVQRDWLGMPSVILQTCTIINKAVFLSSIDRHREKLVFKFLIC